MNKKINLLTLIVIILLLPLEVSCGRSKNTPSSSGISDSVKPAPKYDTVWIACVGDLMCHSQEYQDARTGDGYDFTKFYSVIKPFLSSVDIALGNMETVTAGSDHKFTGYPAFNSPDEYVDALKFAGFDVLTTANNHSLDRSFYGVEKTIDNIERNEMRHTGSYRSEEESQQYLVVNSKGLRLAVLAYTYGTNGIRTPSGKEFCVNYIDEEKIRNDINTVKDLKPDKIIICVHWGEEYQRQPNAFQKRIADVFFDAGADIVFGSHPHVIQPMELRNVSISEGQSKDVFIIYSMGNFISNQRKKYTDSGVIIRLQLIKNLSTGETYFGKIEYVPTYVSTSGGFKILPVQECINAVENEKTESLFYFPGDYSRLKQVWEETTGHLTDAEYGIYPAEMMDE